MRSDEEIIAGCLSGERSAWNVFVDRFARLVYWSIQKTVEGTSFERRSDFIEDVFQEFFKRLLEKEELSRLRSVASLRKFLCVMASHQTHDRMRHERFAGKNIEFSGEISQNGSGPALSIEDFPAPTDPGKESVRRERDEILGKALEALTERERMCVELHYLYDKTHKEIALILGFPQDTVSTVIRRTREKLEAHLSRKGLKDF